MFTALNNSDILREVIKMHGSLELKTGVVIFSIAMVQSIKNYCYDATVDTNNSTGAQIKLFKYLQFLAMKEAESNSISSTISITTCLV